jgi:hypothetical protein
MLSGERELEECNKRTIFVIVNGQVLTERRTSGLKFV